jgi:hypothetical protein
MRRWGDRYSLSLGERVRVMASVFLLPASASLDTASHRLHFLS